MNKEREDNYITYQVWDKDKNQTWFFDVIFPNRILAETIRDGLIELASNDSKKRVSMHTYFELCMIPDNHEELTEHLKWPLEAVSKARIEKVWNGYIIALPKMVMIDA